MAAPRGLAALMAAENEPAQAAATAVIEAFPDGIIDFECGVPEDFLRELEREIGPYEAPAAAWPVDRKCSRQFTAVHHSGTRNVKTIELAIIHCTQSNTAEAAARWFANPRSGGSAHLCADANLCYTTLLPRFIPWAAPGANVRGWHLEIAGFAQWTREQWMARKGLLERSAYKIALHADAYDIPIRLLTAAQLRAGQVGGFATHKRVSEAFGGSHWDPGPGFPLDHFMRRVRFHAANLNL